MLTLSFVNIFRNVPCFFKLFIYRCRLFLIDLNQRCHITYVNKVGVILHTVGVILPVVVVIIHQMGQIIIEQQYKQLDP